MKILKNILKGLLFSPLNAVMILIALIHLLVSSLLKRYKNIKNDLKSFIPTTIHKYKVWKRYKK